MKLGLALVFAVILSLPAGAEDAKLYLPHDAVDLAAILPPPPTRDSAIANAELAAVHDAQAKADDAEMKKATADAKENLNSIWRIPGRQYHRGPSPVATAFSAGSAMPRPNSSIPPRTSISARAPFRRCDDQDLRAAKAVRLLSQRPCDVRISLRHDPGPNRPGTARRLVPSRR